MEMTRLVMALAAIYNLAFSLWTGIDPNGVFTLVEVEPPWPAGITWCLAVSVGLFGLAYAYGAARPDRARPILVLGLAAKIVPPLAWLIVVGFLDLWPVRTFVLIACNDLAWWIPFIHLLRSESGMNAAGPV